MKSNKKIVLVTLLSIIGLTSSCDISFLNKKTHVHKIVDTIVEATCEEGGYTIHECSGCEYSYITNETRAKGHSYKKYFTKSPTFTEDGLAEHYECLRCGKYFDLSKKEVTKESLAIHVDLLDHLDDEEPIYLEKGDLSYYFDFEGYDETVSLLDSYIAEIAQEKKTYKYFENYYYELSSYYNQSKDCYLKAMVKWCMNPTEDNSLNKDKLYEAQTETQIYIDKLIIALGKSSFYKFGLGDGLTEEVIDAFVADVEQEYENLTTGLNVQINNVISGFQNKTIEPFDAALTYVKLSNQSIEGSTYNTYLDYSWVNNYKRDYDSSKILDLMDYIEDYICSAYQKSIDLIDDYVSLSKSDSKIKEALDKCDLLETSFFGNSMDNLRSYASFLSGSYESNFSDFILNGTYFLSNITNNNTTAFINSFSDGTKYMFMGRDYQNVITFIHEFGHYNTYSVFKKHYNYDIGETHSQGNEMLYYAYLAKNVLDPLTGEIFLLKRINSFLESIIVCYLTSYCEKYAYENEDFTKEEFEGVINNLSSKFNYTFDGLDRYVYRAMINSSCYYISYAVSAVSSLEILSKALTSLDDGKNAYLSICTLDYENENFLDGLENASLSNVFSVQPYETISSLVNSFSFPL